MSPRASQRLRGGLGGALAATALGVTRAYMPTANANTFYGIAGSLGLTGELLGVWLRKEWISETGEGLWQPSVERFAQSFTNSLKAKMASAAGSGSGSSTSQVVVQSSNYVQVPGASSAGLGMDTGDLYGQNL